MAPVCLNVKQVIHDIGCGSDEAETEKREYRARYRGEAQIVGQQQWDEDENIFGPLVNANRLDHRLQGVLSFFKLAYRLNAASTHPGTQAPGRIRDHRFSGCCQKGKIGSGIANVGERFVQVGAKAM